jgi:branched-chain amino acid transport system permease protein
MEKGMLVYYIQQLINALSLGGLYALLALGMGIVIGIMRLINFAYGEMITIGAYTIFILVTHNTPWLLAIPFALLMATLGSICLERVAFRPLRSATPVVLLLSSFAVSSLLQNTFLLAVSPRAQGVPTPAWVSQVAQIGPFSIPVVRIITLVVTGLILVGLALFLKGNDLGIAMRAAARDFEAVRILGISADVVIAMAFGISGALAGTVAVLDVARNGVVYPAMGFALLLKAFVAAVIGGMNNLKGLVLGGFVLAFIEIGLQAVLPRDALVFRDAIVFGVVILIMLYKPEGLWGRPTEGIG